MLSKSSSSWTNSNLTSMRITIRFLKYFSISPDPVPASAKKAIEVASSKPENINLALELNPMQIKKVNLLAKV
jgi:hypothetical protein